MLAVTGIGMVSALGLDLVSSCAAARAGIQRIAELSDAFALDEENEELVPLMVCQVPVVSKGLFGFARLLQLGISAIDDLKRSLPAEPAQRPRSIGLIVILPSSALRQIWLEKLRNTPAPVGEDGEPDRDVDPDVELERLSRLRTQLTERMLMELASRTQISASLSARRTIFTDQVGLATALHQVTRWLDEAACETCWVLAVDSYLDPGTLEALDGLRLLRTPSNPAAAIPGELACVLALEKAEHARQKHRPILALIERFAEQAGAVARADDSPRTPGALLAAMAQAGAGRDSDFFVVNLNGDAARASEWGSARVRLTELGVGDAITWIPPLHFGEIGAATGSASIALLARGWARRYAPRARAVVCLLGDAASRAAIRVLEP